MLIRSCPVSEYWFSDKKDRTKAVLRDVTARMDGSQDPLISSQDAELDEDSEFAPDRPREDARNNLSKTRETRPSLFVVWLTIAAGISGLLFGCTFFVCVVG